MGKSNYNLEKWNAYRRRHNVKNKSALGNSQRIITIARRKRGWRQEDLAQKMYRTKENISLYECGVELAPWDELERVMPELQEMRQKGCAFYCDTPTACRIGPCKFARKGRPRKERFQ